MWHRTILVVAVLCLWPLMVAADDNDSAACPHGMMGGGYGMGPGMMGGGGYRMGMMGGMDGMDMMGMMGGGYGHLAQLNLTDDQRAKINKLTDEERRKHWDTMGKIMDQRARLRDLYSADKPDSQSILKVQEQIDLLHRQMLGLHIDTQNKVEALLTPEQREQLKALRSRGRGPGMMGPGGMGPGGGMMGR